MESDTFASELYLGEVGKLIISFLLQLKEEHSKCIDLTPCFSLSFHHKYTQLPAILSASFYLTLQGNLRTKAPLLNKLDHFDILWPEGPAALLQALLNGRTSVTPNFFLPISPPQVRKVEGWDDFAKSTSIFPTELHNIFLISLEFSTIFPADSTSICNPSAGEVTSVT